MLMLYKVRGTLNKNILIMQIEICFQFCIIKVKTITNPTIIINITVMEMAKTLLVYNYLQS
jgi:hypothetical protein